MNDSVKIGSSGNGKPKNNTGGYTGIRNKLGEIAQSATGAARKDNLIPHLPNDLVGGSVPYVPGTEDEAVWNAASQACGTEKVHYCYTIEDKKCWYLAAPSSSMASFPDSWCPLAAALPGNSEFWDKETVYIYEHEGLASALRWDGETKRMQVFIGPSRSILPRIQSMDANFVTISAESATIVPWQQRSLKSEQLARIVAWSIVTSGALVAVIAIAYILTINFMSITLSPDLRKARENTRTNTEELMRIATQTLQNESLKHMVRIQELLDVLGANDGTLLKYEVSENGKKVTWEALVPQAFSAGGVPELAGARPLPGLAEDGRVKIRGTR